MVLVMLTGNNFIGNQEVKGNGENYKSFDPIKKSSFGNDFFDADADQIDKAATLANEAAKVYAKASAKDKALFLECIADEIMLLGDELISTTMKETALPEARLVGERGRTMNQLKMFAALLREGSWVDARIETAIPDRSPTPKPDLRQTKLALGPVAVFGASNFPLAFSVAGGDTASALAAGCPVIVKAHPSHPGASELVARAILSAVEKCDMPNGTFSMIHGKENHVGSGLVLHNAIKAVGFTGSFAGGKTLFDLANSRKTPIPVYAEMGSVNPVFVLPRMAKAECESIAEKYVQSVNLGVGQFCTNPGLLFTMNSETDTKFRERAKDVSEKTVKGVMLTPAIEDNYAKGLDKVAGLLDVAKTKSESRLFETTAKDFQQKPELANEVFGPSSIMVSSETKEEILELAKNLEGQLTASVFGTADDLEEFHELFPILEQKAGRVIINDFPTGVEVCSAMQHGGPFPATTNSLYTSVGTGAINRFARPICYQNYPQNLLPDELIDENPLGIMRLVNREYTRGAIG